MKNKFLFILLILTCSFALFACTSTPTPTDPVTPTPTVPTESEKTETPTPTPTETPVDERYSVKVIFPDNTPVTSGVTVQWCVGDMCFLPQKVNAEGVAYIELEDGEYYIHLNNVPEGYTYNPNGYTTTADNKNITIPLLALSTKTGDGSTESPYVVTTGTYNTQYQEVSNKGRKYYSFTTTEAGSYTIKSICVDKLATSIVDPYIAFIGTDISNLAGADVSSNVKTDINFTHTFEAEANTTYYFIIMVSSVSDNKLPCTVEFNISKN